MMSLLYAGSAPIVNHKGSQTTSGQAPRGQQS
jgi:hypothetical protein